MKISELQIGTAIVVNPVSLMELKEGDACLVGVKCIFSNGKYLPLCKRLSLIPDIFDDPSNDELIILKREIINHETAQTNI